MSMMIVNGSSKKRFHCDDIIHTLESFIVDNEIKGGTMLPSPVQLAAQFAVSSRTMQRAMDALARRNVIYRIRGRGSFVCKKVKPGYVSSVVFLDFVRAEDCGDSLGLNYYAYRHSRESMMERLREDENCRVKVLPVNTAWMSSSKTFALHFFDCIIVAAGLLEKFPQLYELHQKTILIGDSEFRRGDFNQVLVDYTPGFRKALRHYKELGVKRFFVCGCDNETSENRLTGLLEAADQEGYDRSCFTFYATQKNFIPALLIPGLDCAEHYFALQDLKCGIFSLSDYLTVGLLEAFGRRGLVLGRDVPMTSYDNLLHFIPELESQVTFDCIEHPLEEQTTAIVNLCHSMLRGRYENYRCTFTVPAAKFIPYGRGHSG